jgi:hypothetical protein
MPSGTSAGAFMSDIESANWSETAANNNAAVPNGAPEGWPPSSVNDWGREVMAAVKREWDRSHPTVTSGGSANAQTLTYAVTPAALVQGQVYGFVAGFTNTGPTTLQVGSLTAKAVKIDNAALVGDEIQAGAVIVVMYDGAAYQIVSSRALATMTAPNLALNGDMEVWQRGAGGSASIAAPASSTTLGPDGWYLVTGANQACTMSQQAGLTNGSRYCVRVQRNAGQTGAATALLFGHAFDSDLVAQMRGAVVTISVQVRSGANFSPASGAIVFNLVTGTGGAPAKRQAGAYTGEAVVVTAGAALGTSGPVTTVTGTSASIVPTNINQAATYLSWQPAAGTAGAADYIEIDEVMLCIAPVATAFDRHAFAEDLRACQVRYQKSFPYSTAPAQNVGTSGAVAAVQGNAGTTPQWSGLNLPVVMRVAPTAILYNPLAANAQVFNGTRGVSNTGSSITPYPNHILLRFTGDAASTGGDQDLVHYTLDAEI